MSNTHASSSSSSNVSTVPDAETQPLPFLLTSTQGEAARTLLSYVASLGLPGPDSQIVAVVVAIRAARGGVGNVTGADLAALRLADARGAVEALRRLGWLLDDAILDGDPSRPVPISVPGLAMDEEHPLSFGKNTRSRVSGWVTRTLSAKPVKRLPPAARLAGLFLAAHSTSTSTQNFPPDLPEHCGAALPDLLRKGFLAELSEDGCRLTPAVGHLSGMRPPTPEKDAQHLTKADPARPSTVAFEFSAEAWIRWKASATIALRTHAEAVEYCALCALSPERVAEAFMVPVSPLRSKKSTTVAYGEWKSAYPDRGTLAAEFTVAFRTEHGHGPSYTQLCSGLGWKLKRPLRALVVQHLLANEWLTDTAPVPWTLRPGRIAQSQGISLPKARSAGVRDCKRSV